MSRRKTTLKSCITTAVSAEKRPVTRHTSPESSVTVAQCVLLVQTVCLLCSSTSSVLYRFRNARAISPQISRVLERVKQRVRSVLRCNPAIRPPRHDDHPCITSTFLWTEPKPTCSLMHQSIPAAPIPPPGLTPGH